MEYGYDGGGEMMGVLVLIVILVIAVAAIASSLNGGKPSAVTTIPLPPLPANPGLVELEQLKLRIDHVMGAVETDFHMRQLPQQADGARQMRAAVRQYLEALGNVGAQ
jgi:hypothetical protein